MRRKKVIKKFAIIPIIYRDKLYWLQEVVITKHHNGYKYITTSIDVI